MDAVLIELLKAYSEEVMAYSLKPARSAQAGGPSGSSGEHSKAEAARINCPANQTPPFSDSVEDGQAEEKHLSRLERLLAKSGRKNLVVFGVANHMFVGSCARLCNEYDYNLFLCDLDIPRARAFRQSRAWSDITNAAGTFIPVFDASARAILALLAGVGLTVENSVFYLCPGLSAPEARNLQVCMKLFQRSHPVYHTENTKGPELQMSADKEISILTILHPNEPDITEFCTQIPTGIRELVIVWDSPTPFHRPLSAACPIVQCHRDLDGNFAAQRNFALSLCAGNWVLALDGDERLDAAGWAAVTQAVAEQPAEAYFLPRFTLFPDIRHFRMGYGLWPDYQLRLFRRTGKTRFTHPVHEILTGVAGPKAILAGAPILHLSYVIKNRELLEERLEVFNQAMGKAAHHLSREYPHLSLTWLQKLKAVCPDLKYLLLAE